jgi:hypothetical protein
MKVHWKIGSGLAKGGVVKRLLSDLTLTLKTFRIDLIDSTRIAALQSGIRDELGFEILVDGEEAVGQVNVVLGSPTYCAQATHAG